MQVFKQGVVTVKAFLAVTVYLVKGFTDRHTALFQFDLNQWQTIDQDGDIVAIGMSAGLLELFDHLHFVAHEILFIDQVDIFQPPIIEREVADIVDMNFAGLIEGTVARIVQILLTEASPLAFVE